MKKILCLILCSAVLFSLVGCSKADADAAYKRGTYSGSLKSLVTNDYELLREFINTGEFADVKGIIEVSCKDYKLTRGAGAAGTADIATGTFYENGLVEYSTAGSSYNRFRKDYVVEITKIRGSETYWFTSYADALRWLNNRYN